jgi:putative ABC transport system permease protein
VGRVPLGRHNLFADRRRLLASVVGVGLAVMLILLLDGMWAGIRQQATLYTDHAGADLYVLQPGVRDLTAGTGVLPVTTVSTVRADPDVAWAAPVRSAYVIVQLHGTKVAPYVVGSVPGEPGGVWSLASGRAPERDDEIVPDRVLADRHGLGVGDTIDVAGHTFRVVGLADHSSGFMIPFVFVTHGAIDQLTGSAGQTSFVLVGTSHPEAVAARLRAQGLNVLTREQVAANNLKLATGIFGSPIRLMVAIALAAGTLMIALTGYTAIAEHSRDYGIIKALGATRWRLTRLALSQSLTLGALGLVAGGVLFVAGRAVIMAARPQFEVAVTAGTIGTAAVAAFSMALVAALIPARRLAALEPAVAYRSGS